MGWTRLDTNFRVESCPNSCPVPNPTLRVHRHPGAAAALVSDRLAFNSPVPRAAVDGAWQWRLSSRLHIPARATSPATQVAAREGSGRGRGFAVAASPLPSDRARRRGRRPRGALEWGWLHDCRRSPSQATQLAATVAVPEGGAAGGAGARGNVHTTLGQSNGGWGEILVRYTLYA